MKDPSINAIPISLKTLGRGVALGELYDAKSSQFLGVQICPVSVIKEIAIPTDHSSITSHVISSNSLEEKNNVLDIDAKLSVEILAGLVSVSGAASYINDTKSNSSQLAWGLSLQAIVKQESFDVNNGKVKANIYNTDVIEHYGSRATHLATEIVYGGTIIVNFVAKEESKIENKHISGKLEASLNKLSGAFSVKGEVELKIKEECSKISKDLDITIHADVALDRVPVDITTLLAMIPDACEILKEHPVPISVKLKPIPFEAFKKRGYIRDLQNSVLHDVIAKFGELMDIQNRFFTLQRSTAKHKDIIPNLASAVNEALLSFQNLTTPLLGRLTAFVAAYKSGESTEDFAELLKDVQAEIDKQNSSSPTTFSSWGYRTHLAGLEDAFKSFAVLLFKIVNKKKNPKFYITPLSGLRKDIVMAPIVALLIIPPLPSQSDQIDALAIRALLVDAVAFYGSVNPPVRLHIIYTEDLSKIDAALRGKGMFMELKEASVFLGQKKMGAISWTPVPKTDIANAGDQLCDLRLNLVLNPGYGITFLGNIPEQTDPISSQTIIVRAQYYENTETSPYILICILCPNSVSYVIRILREQRKSNGNTMGNIDYLDAEVFQDEKSLGSLVDKGSDIKKLKVNPMEHFHCAFVQDCEISPATWTLYFNGVWVGRMAASFGLMPWKQLHAGGKDINSGQKHNMSGKLYDVRVYNTALTPIQIAADSLNQYTVEEKVL